MENSTILLLEKFIKEYNYSVNLEELQFQLLSHPAYPSVNSITGVLSHFNIDNSALKVPVEKEILNKLPKIFFSITKNSEYILVEIDQLTVRQNFNSTSISMTPQEFIDNWSGIIIVIENNEIQQNSQKLKLPSFLGIAFSLTAICLVVFFALKVSSLSPLIHFTLSIIGIFISSMIVRQEIGYTNKILDSFCRINKSSSCDAVINSKSAYVTKDIKLSDLSVLYFGILSLFWLISSLLVEVNYTVLILSSILSMPVTLYSIYYQSAVIKKWCPLCVLIVIVLWLQFLSFLIIDIPKANLNLYFEDILLFLFCVLLSASVWSFLKLFLQQKVAFRSNLIAYTKLIKNYKIFHKLLVEGQLVETDIPEITSREIKLGNTKAPIELTLVSHPLCSYCRDAHFELESILKNNLEDICLIIRFSVGADNTEDIMYRVVSRVHELFHSIPIESLWLALDEIYSVDVDFTKWLIKWGSPEESQFLEVFEKQKEWSQNNEINFTPALFVNGSKYPNEYDFKHLSFFIEDLKEDIEKYRLENSVSV